MTANAHQSAVLRQSDAPAAIDRARAIAEPALRAAVDALGDERMRRVAGYQLGFWDAAGRPSPGASGKAVRPTLALLAAEAVCGDAARGTAAAVSVELVHNFSLLHDDIMDRDVERRHRPTGWVAFGEGQAILAGNAMLTAAIDALVRDPSSPVTVPILLDTVQQLINGQSADLALEGDRNADLEQVLAMEEGKTAALMSGSLALGAAAGGAERAEVARLHEFGRLVGVAFQLVDDVLGIVGDTAVTGKSASSDVRAGKRSAPVVAALRSGTAAGDELAGLLGAGLPGSDAEVARVVGLIEAAGGVRWAVDEAERLLDGGLAELEAAQLPHREAVEDLSRIAEYLVRRDR